MRSKCMIRKWCACHITEQQQQQRQQQQRWQQVGVEDVCPFEL